MNTENKNVDLNQLTEEQILEIGKQAEIIKKQKKQNNAKQNSALKELKNTFVVEAVEAFLPFREDIGNLIVQFFEKHKIILDLDVELNGQDVLKQNSHTHTLKDGSYSFMIGYNMTDTFDGSEGIGVEKVKQYIDSQKSDDNKAKNLVNALNIFLKPNPISGMLNPRSLKQLSKLKYEYDSELFTEGIEIIEKAAIQVRTSQFIDGWKMITMPDGQFKKMKFRFSI